MKVEPLRSEYRDRDQRIRTMDELGLGAALLFPTLGCGVERILFGSDWTHGEGVAQPLDFEKELRGFDERAVKRIMHDNCVELLRG